MELTHHLFQQEFVLTLVCLLSVTSTRGASSGEYLNDASMISGRCPALNSISSLQDFNQFYSSYSKVYQCLLSNEPAKECQVAEQICQDHGVLYSNVAELGQLLSRRQQGERTCTIEYAVRLYRLHAKLAQISPPQDSSSGGSGLLRILRVLANRWAHGCKSTLAARLDEVEERAPDARKHLDLILGIMSHGTDSEKSIAGSLEVDAEYFIPLLEDELKSKSESIGRGIASGFEYSLTPTDTMTLTGARMSCEALKPYYVNLLGSLGLLASKGFGASTTKSYSDDDQRELVREWVLAASVCQSLKTVLRQSSVKVNGQMRNQVKFVASTEADVSAQEEYDRRFESYNLDEDLNPLDLSAKISPDDLAVYPINLKANLRKLQLLDGPNERLASALYAYLDMSSFKHNRLEIPFSVLGISKT